MIIRGIDFARHTVVVGNESESPVPSSTAGQQPRGEMVARVLAVVGSEATLQLGGQRVVVQTHVPLNAGDKLTVRVFQGEGGAIRLAILASAPGDDALPAALAENDVDALLRELGMPTDDRTRHVARALLARDGALDKPAMQKLLADLRGFPTVTAREANAGALLQKAGAPVTPANVNVVAARLAPNAPLQVGARLAALGPQLEALKRALPAGGPQTALVDDVIGLLKGLPLDENASAGRVEQALGRWLAKLQPDTQTKQANPSTFAQGRAIAQTDAQATDAAQAQGRAAESQGRPSGETAVAGGQGRPPADAARAPGQPAAAAQPPTGGLTAEQRLAAAALGLPVPPEAPEPAQAPGSPKAAGALPPALREPTDRSETAKQGLERADRVSPSQQLLHRLGISTKVPEPAGSDLASMLERLGKGLGTDHQALGGALREAVAELRYAQIANQPAQPGPAAGATGMEFLVPLLVPQLSPDQPEGRIQVFHKPAKEGEPIDPNNVRLVFVLETEHLQTLQADMTIKDGVVELTIGVPDGDNREFLAKHLGELEGAIANQGWETGRFGARLARALPPRVRQEEGLTDIVRFDRRI